MYARGILPHRNLDEEKGADIPSAASRSSGGCPVKRCFGDAGVHPGDRRSGIFIDE
jgi:hypothetical protein